MWLLLFSYIYYASAGIQYLGFILYTTPVSYTHLVQSFDDRIVLSAEKLYERFGRENGTEILEQYFSDVHWKTYEDELVIPDPEPLISYILSCHGNQSQYILDRYKEFQTYVRKKTEKGFRITKDAGVFIAEIG